MGNVGEEKITDVSDLGTCARKCNATDNCCSFMWSPKDEYCLLYRQCDPDRPNQQYHDYKYCKSTVREKQRGKFSKPQVDHLWSTIMSILMDKKIILGFWPTSSTWEPHINQVKLWNQEKWKEKLFQGFRGIAYQNVLIMPGFQIFNFDWSYSCRAMTGD